MGFLSNMILDILYAPAIRADNQRAHEMWQASEQRKVAQWWKEAKELDCWYTGSTVAGPDYSYWSDGSIKIDGWTKDYYPKGLYYLNSRGQNAVLKQIPPGAKRCPYFGERLDGSRVAQDLAELKERQAKEAEELKKRQAREAEENNRRISRQIELEHHALEDKVKEIDNMQKPEKPKINLSLTIWTTVTTACFVLASIFVTFSTRNDLFPILICFSILFGFISISVWFQARKTYVEQQKYYETVGSDFEAYKSQLKAEQKKECQRRISNLKKQIVKIPVVGQPLTSKSIADDLNEKLKSYLPDGLSVVEFKDSMILFSYGSETVWEKLPYDTQQEFKKAVARAMYKLLMLNGETARANKWKDQGQ